MWRQPSCGVVDKRPFVEMPAPVLLGPREVCGDLGLRLGGAQLVRRINLEQAALGLKEAVVLAVALIPPWTT